eukprot:COSAG05_NODE_974_length_6359_cov_3.906869_1_plen_97_part_00
MAKGVYEQLLREAIAAEQRALEALKRESETTERELREQHATEMAAAQTMIEGLVEASKITAEALEHKRRAGSSPPPKSRSVVRVAVYSPSSRAQST